MQISFTRSIVCIGLFFTTQVFAENIVFDNFSSQVVLVKKSSHYQVQGTGFNVKLSHRLILKTASNISKQDVYLYHQQVKKVTELFKGVENNYYSLTLKQPDELSSVLKNLRKLQNKNSGIELVQPDILQIKTKAETSVSPNKASPYIPLLNIQSLWTKTKGKGVKVAVIDDGFNLNHPDLHHKKPTFTYDAETGKLDSLPRLSIDGHGTKVAGIIFAGHNQIGIDGIAPEADFIALRQPDTWTSNTLLSFQLAKLAGASIINCSWHSQWLLQPIVDVVNELAQHGRDSKGIAVIFAAGNEGKEIKPGSTESAIDSAIVVAANDAEFNRLRFSNYGESVDVMTYGKGVKTTLASGGYGMFAGTSLAAAIVSGLSALLLSENPEMSLQELTQQLKLLTK